MRLRPGPRAQNPDAYRPRPSRFEGVRGFVRSLYSRVAPRTFSTGQDAAQLSGGAGWTTSLGGTGTVINIGDPLTGKLWACWGYFCWDSSSQLWGV